MLDINSSCFDDDSRISRVPRGPQNGNLLTNVASNDQNWNKVAKSSKKDNKKDTIYK